MCEAQEQNLRLMEWTISLSQIWQCVMSRGEWNKKEELLAEQAAKHLRHYTPLLAAFAQSAKAEIALLTKVNCFNLCFLSK